MTRHATWYHLKTVMLLLGGFGLASKAHALTESSMKIVEDQGRNEELCAPQAFWPTCNCPTSKSCLRRQLTYSGLQDSLAMVWTGKAFRSCQLLGKPVGKACASPENLRNCLRHAYLPEYVKFMHVIDPSLKKRRHTSAFFSFIMLSWFCIASIWNDISHKFNLKSTNIRWFTWHQAMAPLGSGCWNTLKLQISALQGTNILHQEFIPWL